MHIDIAYQRSSIKVIKFIHDEDHKTYKAQQVERPEKENIQKVNIQLRND